MESVEVSSNQSKAFGTQIDTFKTIFCRQKMAYLLTTFNDIAPVPGVSASPRAYPSAHSNLRVTMASSPEDAPMGTFPPDTETKAETTVLSENPKTHPASFAALSDLDSDDESDDDATLPSLQAAASERAPGAIGMFLYSLFSKQKRGGDRLSAKDTTSAYFSYLKVLFRTQPVSAVFMAVTLGALAVAYATLPVFVNLAFRIVYLSPGVRGVSLDQFARWVGLYSLCIFVCAVVFERTFLYARAGLMREVSLLALQFSEMDETMSDAQLHGFLTSDADEFRRFAHHAHQVVLMSAAAGACFLASLVEVPQLASVLMLFAFAYLVIDIACGVVSAARKVGAGASPRRRAESMVKSHVETTGVGASRRYVLRVSQIPTAPV